ncbi:MAG TPA: ATP-binding protein [Thermoanaerobaculia bacterium]
MIRRRWRDWPWAAKLALLLGALAIVPLTILTLYNAAASRAELIDDTLEQNLQQARNTAQGIDDYLDGLRADVRVLALSPQTGRFLAGSASPSLESDLRLAFDQMRETHGFDAVYLTDGAGRTRLATEDRFLGRSYRAVPFVRKALAGNAGVDEPRYDFQDRRIFIHASAPVLDPEGRILGAVVGRVPLEDLDRILQGDTGFAGRGEYGVLWDADGIRLSHPTQPELRLRSYERLDPEAAARLAAEGRFGPGTLARTGGGPHLPGIVERSKWLLFDPRADPHLRIRSGGRILHASIAPLRNERWLYGLFSPEDAILASVQGQTVRNLLLAVVTAVLAVAAALLAAEWVTTPLRHFGRAAQALAAGDMSRRTGLRQGDEIGQLSAAFDAMAEALAAKEAELRDHAERLEQRVAEQTGELRDLYAREQELRQKAEEANRVKDDFLSTVSHELRTPLNAILGWTWLLSNGKLDGERQARAVATIDRNARSQSQIIDDLLDVSRIVTGKLRLQVEPVDLIQIIEAALDSIRPAADAKEIVIERRLDHGAAQAKGDPHRLQQIVWNLLSNAVKFTPRGGRVEVSLTRWCSQNEIRVTDTGMGISPAFLAHVFDRFRQADSSSTRSHGGLGLGLAIVRHLVELHGGTVDARSDGDGRGATFLVRLPVPAVSPTSVSEPPTARAAGAEGASQELEGVNILLVDDEPDTREVMPAVLERFGAHVAVAASAAEAMTLLQRAGADVLVADIGMPEEDGYSLIGRVRALPGSVRDLPAIALTAYAGEADRRRAMEAGFHLHLAKPVEPAELVSAVAALTQKP